MKACWLIALSLFNQVSFASAIKLTESSLAKLMEGPLPGLKKIEAAMLSTTLNESLNKEYYSPRLNATASRYFSDERALNSFIPVTRKMSEYTIGINKNLNYGMNIGGTLFLDKSSNTFLTDAKTNGIRLNLGLDLYKNFLGKTERKELETREISSKKAILKQEIHRAQYINSLKKIYWSLVANKESEAIIEKLHKTAQKQLQEVNRRYKNGVADSGEVARYQALVSNRKSSLISINYQKDSLVTVLKEMLPSLAKKNVEIGSYNIENTIREVSSCSKKIKSYLDTPYQNTSYDELMKLNEEEQRLNSAIISVHQGPDLKLLGEYQKLGKGLGQTSAYDDFNDNNQIRYQIGLKLEVPLGKEKKNTQAIKRRINDLSAQAEIRATRAKIESFHSQINLTIDHLFKALRNQKLNTKYLNQSLKVSRKKYRQARITATQIIQEEDSFFQSELDVITTNLTVIHTLIDYFSVYHKTPCRIN